MSVIFCIFCSRAKNELIWNKLIRFLCRRIMIQLSPQLHSYAYLISLLCAATRSLCSVNMLVRLGTAFLNVPQNQPITGSKSHPLSHKFYCLEGSLDIRALWASICIGVVFRDQLATLKCWRQGKWDKKNVLVSSLWGEQQRQVATALLSKVTLEYKRVWNMKWSIMKSSVFKVLNEKEKLNMHLPLICSLVHVQWINNKVLLHFH